MIRRELVPIGVKDLRGNNIFIGDIIKMESESFCEDFTHIDTYIVVKDDGQFTLYDIYNNLFIESVDIAKDGIVTGNVF